MPGRLKTEAIVLRSMRYGEADRILHLYTPDRGRVSAIAKGVRRARSRFGGRLEPFSRVALHAARGPQRPADGHGRGHRRGAPPPARRRGDARRAGRACDAVSRLFETADPHPPVYHLLCHELALLDADPAAATLANQLAFRLKLLLAAGLAPAAHGVRELRRARAPHRLLRRRRRRGCAALRGLGVPARRGGPRVHDRLDRPARCAEAPDASPRALRQAERAIPETAEHHAHVRLRAALAG